MRKSAKVKPSISKDPERLRQIVASRITEFRGTTTPLLDGALELFTLLRADSNITKKPATAELLDWMLALIATGASLGKSLREQPEMVRGTLAALIKQATVSPPTTASSPLTLGGHCWGAVHWRTKAGRAGGVRKR